MPQPGLSLVGFMDQTEAINHFLTSCIPPDPAIAALIAEWGIARARLGGPVSSAGNPDIQPIPTADQSYIQQLAQQQWVATALAGMPNSQFMLVEIEPLLAYQFTVDNGRSDHHCNTISQPPSVADMLPICLPHAFPAEQINVQQQQNSILLKAQSLNVRMTAQGFFQAQNTIGI